MFACVVSKIICSLRLCAWFLNLFSHFRNPKQVVFSFISACCAWQRPSSNLLKAFVLFFKSALITDGNINSDTLASYSSYLGCRVEIHCNLLLRYCLLTLFCPTFWFPWQIGQQYFRRPSLHCRHSFLLSILKRRAGSISVKDIQQMPVGLQLKWLALSPH